MLSAAKLQVSNPAIDPNHSKFTFDGHHSRPILRQPYDLRLPIRFRRQSVQSEYASLSSSPEPSVLSHYTSSVAPPSSCSSIQLSNWNLTHRHILVLNVVACAAAVSATWLFFSAIPTLLSFKKAAESLEKLMDATREELPETMAAVRLSGMEISDLTMELSDLGQEITQGVRSSTRAVRLAEERLRRLTNMSPPASVQVVAGQKTDAGGPVVARTARSMKDGIVKGRTILQMFFILTGFSRMALKFIANRAKK